MRFYIENMIRRALEDFSLDDEKVFVEHPVDLSHGDYTTNAALLYAGNAGYASRDFAEMLALALQKMKGNYIDKIEVAGPGFINFFLSKSFFLESLRIILNKRDSYGKSPLHSGDRVLIEYTDPNPFKEFHIGHLMSNAIGESLSRIIEFSGAEVKRANYQGDVGLHVAKALWGLRNFRGKQIYINDLGKAYTAGAEAYEMDGAAKTEIHEINKKVYEGNDTDLLKLYETGRSVSLSYFETLYKKLGTKFDYLFFESDTGVRGKKIVTKNIGKIFEESDGAIIFRGEQYGLHTRVFITKDGFPTYEAKELGLAEMKYDIYPHTTSIVVTGSEVTDYFKVLLQALLLIYPELAKCTKHIPHGMLRLPTGKMSSRTGDVITAESLIKEGVERIFPKVKENKEIDNRVREELAESIAIGAIKYSVLKQAIGNDIIFDFNVSLSFEGDSGPYIQYTYARAMSVLRKGSDGKTLPDLYAYEFRDLSLGDVERLLYRFPEVLTRANQEYAPHHVATYLIALAQAFNNFYARERIVEGGDLAPYRVALTSAVAIVLKNGLYLLGINAPEKM